MSKYEAVYFVGDNQAINRVRIDSSKTRNRGAFSGSLAALLMTLYNLNLTCQPTHNGRKISHLYWTETRNMKMLCTFILYFVHLGIFYCYHIMKKLGIGRYENMYMGGRRNKTVPILGLRVLVNPKQTWMFPERRRNKNS